MRSYGQYCPIARASEILAERWTPIILRNLLNGASTFNEIAADAPGIPRSLLTTRLRGLERMGVIEIAPNPRGQGSVYRPTEAGRDLRGVLQTMGRTASDSHRIEVPGAVVSRLTAGSARPSVGRTTIAVREGHHPDDHDTARGSADTDGDATRHHRADRRARR